MTGQILKPVHPYVGLANYQELFGDYVWWIAVKNTIVFTVMTVVGTTVVALLAAVAVTQPVKGSWLFPRPAVHAAIVVGRCGWPDLGVVIEYPIWGHQLWT